MEAAMSDNEKDSMMDCLFSGQDMTLRNIKFCRGSDDLIAPEDLRAQSHSAMLQKRTGAAARSTVAPHSQQPVVDLEKLFS
jgi:hypothetical protein